MEIKNPKIVLNYFHVGFSCILFLKRKILQLDVELHDKEYYSLADLVSGYYCTTHNVQSVQLQDSFHDIK